MSLIEPRSPSADFPFHFSFMGPAFGGGLKVSTAFVGWSSWECLASAVVTRKASDNSKGKLEDGAASITQSEELEGDFVWERVVFSHFRKEIYGCRRRVSMHLS